MDKNSWTIRNKGDKHAFPCCPECRSTDIMVFDSRGNSMGIRRRRKCLACENRWNTLEVMTDGLDILIKAVNKEKLNRNHLHKKWFEIMEVDF